ncbi:hypothetical protein [Bacillus sp. JJ722]|uniref:hypothetical protein n=1 Tax=Bacillus sp. JJ722 TaxID=3122973 RepID=UPI002FFEED35
MKYKKRFILIIFLLIVSVSSIINMWKWKENDGIATWVWDAELLKKEFDQTVKFIKDQELQSVYIQYSSTINTRTYKRFITSMHDIGVDVYALDGGPDWGITNHEDKDHFLNWFVNYQDGATNKEKFKGIHLDVEPYLLDEWKTIQDDIVKKYISLITKVKAVTTHTKTSLGVDIPFWYDKIVLKNEKQNMSLAQWIIHNVDETTIMAYRNFANGNNGIIDITAKEVDWAEQAGTSLYIAVETVKLPEKHTSFYQKGKNEMSKELEKVSDHYKDRISGIAIHHLESWKDLKY